MKVLPSFVNRTLESLYSKQFMANHSKSGKECPTKKKKKVATGTNPTVGIEDEGVPVAVSDQVKPGLPEDDLKAIRGNLILRFNVL